MSQTASISVETLNPTFDRPPLPEGWRWVKLGDVCEVVTGSTPPKAESRFYGGIIAWIKPNDLDRAMYVDSSSEYLSDEGAKRARILPAGSVLVSCIGNVGKAAIAAKPLATNQQINSLIPSEEVDSDYLFFACRFIGSTMRAAASMSLVPIINKSSFSALKIPLPPFPEQKRIAAILKERMAGVERARAAAEAQLKAAKDLPAAYLRAVFDSPEAKQWERKRFDEMATDKRIGLVRSSTEQSLSATYPYLKMDNITNDGHLRLQQVVRVEATSDEVARYCLRQGDFLFNTRNSFDLVGKTAVFDLEEEDWLFNNNIMRVRFIDEVLSDFVLWAFHGDEVKSQLESVKSNTTNVCAIYDRQLATITIPLPPLVRQKQIALALNNRMVGVSQIMHKIQDEIDTINKLPAALLRQAFNGKL
jgi:type I restriction enzyme, S subunit